MFSIGSMLEASVSALLSGSAALEGILQEQIHNTSYSVKIQENKICSSAAIFLIQPLAIF